MNCIYMDESGRTGRHIYRDGKWNYYNNAYFALGGILLDDKYELNLQADVKSALSEANIQGELKFSKKNVKKVASKLSQQFLKLLKKYHAKLYIEIVQQKFCDCMWITNYLIFPYYDTCWIASGKRRIVSRIFANYVYKKISDEIIWACIDVLDSATYDKSKLISCCKLLREDKILRDMVDETIDSIQSLPLPEHNFFPLKDSFKNETSYFAISPHIDSFNNIITRANLDSIHGVKKVIHDEENELFDALIKWGEKQDLVVEFRKSKNNHILQLADFFVGNTRALFEQRSGDFLDDYASRINLVSYIEDQLLLRPNDSELLEIKQLIDSI